MSSFLTLDSSFGLLDLALKGAVVMVLASVVALLMRRASAAWRHLAWCLGLVCLLVLPVLSVTLPAWGVGWLPEWNAERAVVVADGEAATLPVTEVKPRIAPPIVANDVKPPVVAATTETPSDLGSEAQTALPVAVVEASTPVDIAFPLPLSVWIAGAVLSLVPLCAGLWQLAALHRRSRVIDESSWLRLLEETRQQLNLRRAVQLRRASMAIVPFTWGALSPVLLLPADADGWDLERRRVVLLHELAHVRRADWLTQFVAHFACALHWFNPLVWLAARQMRIERERAADDLVLACGVRASDFAQELLALAVGLGGARLSTLVAVPMARRGALEDRVRGILDCRRSHAPVTSAAMCLGALLAVAAAAPLAMIEAAAPTRPESADGDAEKRGDGATMKKAANAESPKPTYDVPLVGKEAAERVKKFAPSFSKAQDGLEFGVSLASDRKAFHVGERVPLEFAIRNVSKKTLHIEHNFYAPHDPPAVIGADGKKLSIEAVFMTGIIRRHRNVLKPNEVVVYWHHGLGLGDTSEPPGTFWRPFLKKADAVPGKYRLTQELHVKVREDGRDGGEERWSHATTGEVPFEIKLVDAPKADAAAGEAPAEVKPAEQPTEKAVTFRGKVVDDATGEPVEAFSAQAGRLDPADSKKVLWGYKADQIDSRDGSFSTTIRWGEGWIETLPGGFSKSYSSAIRLSDRWNVRIMAAGYYPKPLFDAGPPEGKYADPVTVRVTRVPERVRGVVLDHAGKPAKDAAIFTLGGGVSLILAGGRTWDDPFSGGKRDHPTPVRTDGEGRFEIVTGGATTLAVTHARLDAWQAAVPPAGDLTIRLPKPARVEVELDIAGAEKEAGICYQIIPHLMGFESMQSERVVHIANPGKLVLDTLPPGHYQFWRGSVRMLDRQVFELKAGETKTIDMVRGKGARVRGKVTWPADAKLSSVVVTVLDGKTAAALSSQHPGDGGAFLTERIPAGTHHLEAYAYRELSPEEMIRSGIVPPSHIAQVTIEVPAEGELVVKDLALKLVKRGE